MMNNNRLNITMDYFIKNSEDVLVGLRLPLYTGFGNDIPRNTASIENKGFEFLGKLHRGIWRFRIQPFWKFRCY